VAEDLGGDHREPVGALWRVEFLDHLREDNVVDLQARGQSVRLSSPGFFLEMEEAGVVLLVRLPEEFDEPRVDRRLARQSVFELAEPLYPPVLADPEEDDPVDGVLDRGVQLPDGEVGVVPMYVLCQDLPPESISRRKPSSTVIVPLAFFFDSMYLSREPPRTASREKRAAICPMIDVFVVGEVAQKPDPRES
jgi:hypothetical protein